MAAIASTGSGNWSSTTPDAPWPSGTVPTSVDDVTITSGHTVTLDALALEANLLTIDGTVDASTTASSVLTLGTRFNVTTIGALDIDISSNASISCIIEWNKLNSTTNSVLESPNTLSAVCFVSLKGAAKTCRTRLDGGVTAGATSAIVDALSGWQVGDTIILCSTAAKTIAGSVDEHDAITIDTIDVGTRTITWTGGITYDHVSTGYVANMTRNIVLRPASTGDALFKQSGSGTGSGTLIIDYCELYDIGRTTSSFGRDAFVLGTVASWSITNSSFNNYLRIGLIVADNEDIAATFDNNVFFSSSPTAGTALQFRTGNQSEVYPVINNCLVARGGSNGFQLESKNRGITNSAVLGCGYSHNSVGAIGSYNGGKIVLDNVSICGCHIAFKGFTYLEIEGSNCKIGTEFGAKNYYTCFISSIQKVTLTDSGLDHVNIIGGDYTGIREGVNLISYNTDGDVLEQRNFLGHYEYNRENTIFNRSSSSVVFELITADKEATREQNILCSDGETITVVGYAQYNADYYNSGTWVAPTVTLSGLGEPPVVYSASTANVDAWEKYTITITNNSGADGEFQLTFSSNATNVAGTPLVYFDGVPDYPWVAKCRHYGYLFDESIPTRTINSQVSVDEATAIAYTGVTVVDVLSEISFSAGTADTAQKFYDYTQAYCAANIDTTIPFARAGSTYSIENGWTIIDPYYAGELTWSGGTIEYGSIGTKSDTLDGCIIDFTAVGAYVLDGVITGTIELINTSGNPITVEVPTGTSVTNTGPDITVTNPLVYQSVTIDGAVAGSRIQIYDTSLGVELYNDTPTFPYTWTDPSAYSADRPIRLRVMYMSGVTAKEFINVTIGTSTFAAPALSYLVAQVDDAVYNVNAIDGSLLTGYAIVGTQLSIAIDDGSATWPEMYAYEVYWLNTAAGIEDQMLSIVAVDAANFIFFGGFKIKNTSSPSVPLLILGGNGVPNTGAATDLLDTTGGTIFINSDTVVPYGVTDILADPRSLTVIKYLSLKG